MPKYTVVGDPHAKVKNLDKLHLICEKVEALGNRCIWLGDMLDTKTIIQGKCLNFWIEYFRSSKLQHVVIVGNHDRHSNFTKEHSLEVFRELDNVFLVNGSVPIPGTPFHAIPYVHDPKEFKALVKKVPKDSVLFCHAEIANFDFGNGFICDNIVKASIFKKLKRVVSGHFHSYQTKGNLTYLGTPFSHSFGETDQVKYLGVYDSETDKLELIRTNLTQHCTISVDCDAEEAKGFCLDNENDLYRIVLKGTQANVLAFPKESVQNNHSSHVVFISKPTDMDDQEIDIEESLSPEKQFSKWGKSINLSKKALVLGLEILEDVKC